MMSRARALVALLAWTAGAALTIGVLAGSPVVGDEPVTVGFELLRRAALGAAWYVVIAAVAGTVGRTVRAGALVRVADALTVAPLRSTLRAAVGAGVAGVLTLSPAAIAASTAPEQPPPIVTLQRLPEGGAPTTTTITGPVTTTTLAPATTTTTRAPAAPAPRPAPAPPDPAATLWRVRPGECFWTIADHVLSARLGRPVSDREIVPYWRRMIAENRPRLRDPANADLLFPGQIISLP